MQQKIRIMLADDHALLRAGLKLLLQKNPLMEVVGEAADGIETVKLYEQLMPDLLILDITLPLMDGIECLKEIKARTPQARILVVTMHEDEEYIKKIIHSGASGYVPKSAVDQELFTAINTVMQGYTYLRPQETQLFLRGFYNKTEDESDPQSPYQLFSVREREVLRLLVRGHSLSEIGEEINLSVKTVDTYKSRIMTKLNANRKSELVTYALKYKLLAD